MEYYKSLSSLQIVHVPYRGTGSALNDVIGGQVEMIYDTLASSSSHIKAGSLLPMAVAPPQRLTELPAVPTFAETGLMTFNADLWSGVLAPADLPAEVLETLHDAIVRVLYTPAIKARYGETGALVVEDAPADCKAIIAADVDKWKKVATSANITLD